MALGATLYYLLTGQPPLRGETEVQTFVAIQEHDPLPPSHHNRNISADLDAICLKCLEKNPQRRYQTASRACRGSASVAGRKTSWSQEDHDLVEGRSLVRS